MTVTISLSETVANKENYRLEYSKDNRNWSKYAETSPITMTQNGKIYARTKDITGDIKVEGGYAEGEVTIIDKKAPTPGSITMKMASLGTPYIEGTEVYQNVAIELQDGQDEEEGSGHKLTTCEVTGIPDITMLNADNANKVILKTRDEDYKIKATITTGDNAGNTVTMQKEYTVRTIYAKETKKLQGTDDTYYLPEGFKLAEDSATQISEGMVVEDRNGNQFVWIPCYLEGGVNETEAQSKNLVKYDRYDINNHGNNGYDTTTSSLRIYSYNKGVYFVQKLYDDEKESIKLYGGYFIGRFEAGDKYSTELKTMRNSSSSSSNQVTIQKNQAPYNYIRYSNSASLANNMATANAYNEQLFTRLCSSYAHDTAVKFIENSYPNYGSTSKKGDKIIGNFSDTTFNYMNLGATNVESKTTQTLVPTGQTTPICNIYDISGNADEYTTETVSAGGQYYVARGGNYADSYSNKVGYRRFYGDANNYITELSFRIALYIK